MQRKLNKLTPEQAAAMIAHRDYWLKTGLSTEPSDRQTTERIVTEFYRMRGLDTPYFWWCDGPMVAQLVMNILKNKPFLANLSANLSANLWDNLWDNLRDNLWTNLRDNLSDNLRDNLSDNLRDNLRDNLWDNLSDNLMDNLWANLWANLSDNLSDNLRANLMANLRANLRDNKPEWFYTYFWGSLDSYWVAFYLFPQEYLGLKYDADKTLLLSLWADLSRSTFWWWPFEKLVVLSDRPASIHRDERGRLHNESGPACSFRDGWAVWYWHGVHVPADIIENSASITVQRIEDEENAEVRRIMVERYGQERFLMDSSAIEIHSDRYGTLYRKELANDEPLVMVKVTNSTPEPDGYYKDYFLRVPPTTRTAHEGVAWTFGKTVKTYAPIVET